MTTLQRLLKYPHAAVFDKDPGGELVFRLRHPDGCSWSIGDGVMTVAAGAETFTYDLASVTVTGLATRLIADGFEVLHVTSRYGHLSGLVLVEGSGDQGVTNGDHILAFTSLLWVLLSTYTREVDAAAFQVRQALLQMVMTTAEGEWLDLWGALYAVDRLPGETDAVYRLRIPVEAFRLRVNPRAIEIAIKDATGKDVQILEPWTTIFTLDQSTLDGPDKFQDSERIGYFYIQAMSRVPIDWSDVLPIIERNKPAGVLMLPPQVRMSTIVESGIDGSIWSAVKRRHAAGVRLEDLALLDYADIEETSVLNYPILARRSVRHRSLAVMDTATWLPHPWQTVPWNEITYVVSSKSWRSYRVYRMSLEYSSRSWPATPWTNEAWSGINAVIGTAHSRVS